MTATCLIQEIKSVDLATQRTTESYETMVNTLLDKINEYRSMLDDLNQSMIGLNNHIANKVCGQEEAESVILMARELIRKFKILFRIVKSNSLYRGYKTSLQGLILTVNDFEEYIHDFKFRHDRQAQSEINDILKGFSLVV